MRARKGYFAYTLEDVKRASAPAAAGAPSAVTSALNAIAEPARGRAARFWVGMSKGTTAGRVTFAWEPVAGDDGQGKAGSESAAARVMLTVTAQDGRPVFRGRVPDEAMPSASSTPNPMAAGSSVSFDSPPGQLQLRMVVENSRGQVMDSATQELTVPDFAKVQVSLSTPRRLSRPHGS